MTIAISGMPGAGSSSVGRLLAKELEIKFFSMGQIWKDIGTGKVKEQSYYPILKEICDKKGFKIPELKSKNDSEATIALWKGIGSTKEFNEITDRLQIELAKRGNIVIDGKLALRMLVDVSDFKIWLKADIDDRAKRVSERDKIDFERAKEIILEREGKEREEWKKIYGFDYFEQEKEADIIINSSEDNPSGIVEEILEDNYFKEE